MFVKLRLLPVLWAMATLPAFGQDAQSCKDIQDTKLFWENVRILPPATITDFDGMRIQYSFSTEQAVYVAGMELYADADLPVGFADKALWKRKGSKWWICYCALDRKVFFIQDYDLNERLLKQSKKLGAD